MKRRIPAEEFIDTWQKAESLADFCKATGMKRFSAMTTAVKHRAKGVPLRLFKPGPRLLDYASLAKEAQRIEPVTPERLLYDPFKFVRVWQTAKSLAEVTRKMGLTKQQATVYAARFRKQGVPLKRFVATGKINNARLGELRKYAEGHGTPTWMIVSAQRRQIKKLEAELEELRKR